MLVRSIVGRRSQAGFSGKRASVEFERSHHYRKTGVNLCRIALVQKALGGPSHPFTMGHQSIGKLIDFEMIKQLEQRCVVEMNERGFLADPTQKSGSSADLGRGTENDLASFTIRHSPPHSVAAISFRHAT